jgi:hypothetical protein
MPKLNFRGAIYEQGTGLVLGTEILQVNEDYDDEMNLNEVISKTLAFIRRFEAAERSVEGVVFGKPTGDAVVGSVYTLDGTDLTEHQYAHLDAPSAGLKARVAASNSIAGGAEGFPDLVPPSIGIAA